MKENLVVFYLNYKFDEDWFFLMGRVLFILFINNVIQDPKFYVRKELKIERDNLGCALKLVLFLKF